MFVTWQLKKAELKHFSISGVNIVKLDLSTRAKPPTVFWSFICHLSCIYFTSTVAL